MHPDPPAWNNLPAATGTPATSVTQAHGVNGLSESDGGATAFSIREGEKRNCTLGCMLVACAFLCVTAARSWRILSVLHGTGVGLGCFVLEVSVLPGPPAFVTLPIASGTSLVKEAQK